MSRRTRASAAKKKEAPPAPKIEEPVPGPAPSPTPEEQAQPPARPRRRREQSEASAFLSKTYAMISALDGVVGGWSKNGDTMVIFDSEKFAAEIIPQYFKHNNFRSFVRQLNFYGFRKLRADANAGPAAQARWEFKHPNFRRGRHDLLVLIRRAEHYDHGGPDAAAQRARQAELEREVADLRSKVANLTETLDKVRADAAAKLPPNRWKGRRGATPTHFGRPKPTAPGHEHGRKRDGLEKKPRTPLPVGLRFK